MALAAFMGFLTVGSGVGLLMTSAYIIAKAALPVSIADLQIGIVGVRFFGIFRGVFRYLERLISHEVTFRLLANFRVWFFSGLEPLAPAKTQSHKGGDLLSRFVTDVQELQNIFLRVIAPPIIAIFVLILMWFLFGFFSPIFSIVFLLFYLIAAFIVPFIGFRIGHKIGLTIIDVRSQLQVKSVELVQGMSELAIYDTKNIHFAETMQLNEKLASLQQNLATVNGLTEALIGLLMNGAVVSLLYFGIDLVNTGSMDGVYLSVIVLGVMASFEALLPLPIAFQNLSKSMQAAQRLFEVIDGKKEEQSNIGSSTELENWDIELNNVSFTYEQEIVLKKVSLKIPQGKKIVIAGRSGAGKSTLVNLLLTFWQPDSGKIKMGGQNIDELDASFLREHLSVFNQDYFLFNSTIRENLQLANHNAAESEFYKAIKQANLQQKLASLNNGYNTSLGEHGLSLSGGERQRLCLARTFLKDAPIYIFDEPTSQVDAENEKHIFDAIFKLGIDKTVIVITHRLTHLDKSDYIYFLEDGEIRSQGTFEDLMELDGVFKASFDLQKQVFDSEVV
jgi:ATP-binding cassette subfamily C protein CydC